MFSTVDIICVELHNLFIINSSLGVCVDVGVGGSIVINALGWNQTEEETMSAPLSTSNRFGPDL